MSTARLSYSLTFPADLEIEQVVSWLEALSGLLPSGAARLGGSPMVGLEVWATPEQGFRYRVTILEALESFVIGQLRVALPGVRATPTEAITAGTWSRVVELGMHRHQRTLRVEPETVAASLLASLQGVMLRRGEVLLLQWIIRPAVPERAPAPAARRRSVSFGTVGSSARDAVNDVRTKLDAVNFLAVLRIGVQAGNPARAVHLLAGVRAALRSVRTADNTLYVRTVPQARVKRRLISAKAPLLFPLQLTATELAGLLAWPVGSPHVAGLPQSRSRHLPPSGAIAREGLVVARANFPGAERPLALSPREACKHLHIVGPTGVGKTVLMANLVMQAMAAGSGVIVMESKGDLFAAALDAVPRKRIDDVIMLDVRDARPVGYNLLSEGDPRIAVEELCQLFEYLYPDMRRGVWARAALHRGLMTLITRPGTTFIDLVPLLSPGARSDTEAEWRDELVDNVADPELVRFWQRFDGLSPHQQEAYAAPVLDRVWQLNERPAIRRIIGQGVSSFSLQAVLRERKILLISLAGLGVETGRLVGTLLLNSIWSAVRSGAADPDRPTHLFLDEFQDFLNLPVDPETMLVRARSYGLAMTLAHQHLEQLPGAMRSAVLANARSKVVFQTTADDAKAFGREFGRAVTEDDFMNLAAYEVLCRLATREGISPPVSAITLPPPEGTGWADTVRARSAERYGRDHEAIEAEIAQRRMPRQPRQVRRPRLGGSSWDL